jgi:hypothetical protein
MVTKTMERHVLPLFTKTNIVITTFDLWVSWAGFDIFVLVINYINKKWQPYHITMGIFKVPETNGVVMAMQLKKLLSQYELLDKVIMYVKDEGANLSTFTTALTIIISCVPLSLPQPYAIVYYEHAMFKCC